MERTRPITTLFMLMSIDGKISTGESDAFDFDADIPKIKSIVDGLHQYYDIEKTTDLWSLNTGRVFNKLGYNGDIEVQRVDANFIIIDNVHLKIKGIVNLSKKVNKLVLVTSNLRHPAIRRKLDEKIDNLSILYYDTKIDLKLLMEDMYRLYRCESITIQSGSTLNSELFKHRLIDKLDIVIAPFIVGGKGTPTLVGGEGLKSIEEVVDLNTFKLNQMAWLDNSYIRLQYSLNT